MNPTSRNVQRRSKTPPLCGRMKDQDQAEVVTLRGASHRRLRGCATGASSSNGPQRRRRQRWHSPPTIRTRDRVEEPAKDPGPIGRKREAACPQFLAPIPSTIVLSGAPHKRAPQKPISVMGRSGPSPGTSVVTPNRRTGGGRRGWKTSLAAPCHWGLWAKKKIRLANQAKTRTSVAAIYKNSFGA